MIKHKVTKTKPKSTGQVAQKIAKTQPKSNGHHDLRSANTPLSSNGKHDGHATSERSTKPAVKHAEQKTEKFHGVLQDFNLSPKGGIEGFVLQSDGQTVQINVSLDIGFAVVRGIGQTVEATVGPAAEGTKHGKGDHSVYDLITLITTDGKGLIYSGEGAGGNESVTVEGTIKRINYARHGAANGVVLDSGDFIHLKPEGMKRVDLKPGDHVTAEGMAALMPLGQRIIEAKMVNGTSITGKKPAGNGNHRMR